MTTPFERVSELFHELCDLDRDAQAKRLAEIARSEPEVHAKLQELLADDHSSDPRLEGAAVELLSAGGEKSFFRRRHGHLPDPAPVLEPEREIGDYRLIALLGQGGMGQVWEAEQVSLKRRVALKFLRAGERTEKQLELFGREARAGGRLSHPGIVSVHGYGQSDGLAWIAMELVKGAWTLRNFLDEAARMDTLPANHDREAARLVAEIADAMQAAHEAKVIHRDLKPQNVLIAHDNKPKVTDFGLARLTDESALSRTNELAGTYYYMSPEQVAAKRAGIDHRTDIFSLGIVLYELLTLRRPFEGDSMHQVAAQILAKDPPDPRTIRSRVPWDLAVIASKALEKDRDKRFQTMKELATDLRRHLANEPIQARPPTRWDRTIKWIRRNPTKSAAGTIVVVALMVITGLLIQNVRTNRALVSERTNLANASSALERKTAEAEASAEAATRDRNDVLRLSALQKLNDLTAEADRLWPANPEILSKCEQWLSKARELLAELPQHVEKLAELRTKAMPWTEAKQARHEAGNPRLAELRRTKRNLQHHMKLRAALESSEPAEDPTAEEVGVELASLPTTARDVNSLAWTLIDPDRKDWGGEAKGLVLVRRALEIASDLSLDEQAEFQDTLAWALFANGRFDEAVAAEEQALQEAAMNRKAEFQGYLERLKAKIEEEIDPEKDEERGKKVTTLEQRIAKLEAEVSRSPEWLFVEAEDKWWHAQLEKLVASLNALWNPETGLASGGISPEHGWSIPKRAEFARTIIERSVSGAEASAKWAATLSSISTVTECQAYGGLRMSPQLGLVPIGRDPASGLWEFAHLQTGEPAERGSDGKLIMKEESGLVFVLLPGGTFTMGAQRSDPTAPNYDPDATPSEGPVHEVTLSPFFLSKYEMTQGQWQRFTGKNPSNYSGPGNYEAHWERNRRGRMGLHPVEHVNRYDSTNVMDRLALILPTEAQWEYGCRGGSTTVYWCGDKKESLLGVANVADDYGRTHGYPYWMQWEQWDDGHTVHAQIGSYLPNVFGLHDMHGNVQEECKDAYEAYGVGPLVDPLIGEADSPFYITRGGNFLRTAVNARSAVRFWHTPQTAGSDGGLRPARGIAPWNTR